MLCCFAFLMTACEIDNYDGPNASFSGVIRDAQTGEPVGTDIQNGAEIRAFELGFASPTAQVWPIKNTGEFMNSMVFAAHYDFDFSNANFFPFQVKDMEIKPGDNVHDFQVTPYIRIKDAEIKHDQSAGKIVATFWLEAGAPEVLLREIRLFAFSDMWVGNSVRFELKGDGFHQTFSEGQQIDDTRYTLTIDLQENKDVFRYNKNYYFRIGALANVQGVGTVRHNYAPTQVIPL